MRPLPEQREAYKQKEISIMGFGIYGNSFETDYNNMGRMHGICGGYYDVSPISYWGVFLS